MTKYVFVSGGVVSSLGKGMCRFSSRHSRIGGIRVTLLKLDPYINVDPGTIARSSTGRFS